MTVEKGILFEQTKGRWPRRIRVFPTSRFPFFYAEPCLVDVHSRIQAACDPKGEWSKDDEWTGLANWSFHQALWTVAQQSKTERDIDCDEVTFEMFDECMRSNLLSESWADERRQYEESPLRFH